MSRSTVELAIYGHDASVPSSFYGGWNGVRSSTKPGWSAGVRDAGRHAPRSPFRPEFSRSALRSQRVEERDERVLVRHAENPVVEDDRRGLARVPQDRLVAAEAQAIVHQPNPGTHAPQRSRPDLVAGGRPAVLDDPVTGADVVQQEIAERVDRLAAEGDRHGEGALVDHGSRRRGCDGPYVAGVAADQGEQLVAAPGARRGGEDFVPWRSLGGPHEPGEGLHVLPIVIGIANGV